MASDCVMLCLSLQHRPGVTDVNKEAVACERLLKNVNVKFGGDIHLYLQSYKIALYTHLH